MRRPPAQVDPRLCRRRRCRRRRRRRRRGRHRAAAAGGRVASAAAASSTAAAAAARRRAATAAAAAPTGTAVGEGGGSTVDGVAAERLALAPGQLLVKGPAAAAEAALLLVELPRASDDGGGVVDTEERPSRRRAPLPLAPLAVTAQWPIALALMADRLQLIALPSGELLHALTYPPFLQDGLDAIGDHARRFTAGDVSTKGTAAARRHDLRVWSNALLAVGESVCRVPLMPAASLLAHADRLRELSLGGVGGEAEAAAARRLRELRDRCSSRRRFNRSPRSSTTCCHARRPRSTPPRRRPSSGRASASGFRPMAATAARRWRARGRRWRRRRRRRTRS